MERSIDMLLDDLRNSIIGTLNNSNLPLSILALVLKDINNDIQVQAKAALETSKQNYMTNMQQEQATSMENTEEKEDDK